MADTRKIVANVIVPALGDVGYTPDYLRRDYLIPDFAGIRTYIATKPKAEPVRPAGNPDRLDVLAFTDPDRQNWNTSAVAVDLRAKATNTEASQKRARALFDATASPTALVGRGHDAVDMWFNCHNGMTSTAGVALNAKALGQAFRDRQTDVRRERLADLRTGQRHLFESHLYVLRGELVKYLQRGIQAAVSQIGAWWDSDAPKYLAPKYSNLRAAFSKIALALLAARILEDKGAFGKNRRQSTDARQLLTDAEQKYDTFFSDVVNQQLPALDKVFPNQSDGMLEGLLSHLTGPVNFGLVTHEMLGDLYEQADLPARRLAAKKEALFTDEFRLRGVHYTPFPIARRIIDRIPFEDLRPADRLTCDLTCGSGAFLISATDRLDELHDPREPGAGTDRLAYLQRSVCGNDVDAVAVLLVQLTYLLAYWSHSHSDKGIAYPKLTTHNALDTGFALSQEFEGTPSVFVGNPPFDADASAGAFLTRAVDTLWRREQGARGFIGMVLPQTFLRGEQHHRAAREHLLTHANILEVWELPEHAVGDTAEVATCVIIAEVCAQQRGHARVARVEQTYSRRGESVAVVRDRGVPTWSRIALCGENTVTRAPVHFLDSTNERTLGTIAHVVWGFLQSKDKKYAAPIFRSSPAQGYVPYLHSQSALRPYALTESDWLASQARHGGYWKLGTGPRPREQNWPYYRGPKIVMTGRGTLNQRSQVVAALDTGDYYPGKDFLTVAFGTDYEQVWNRSRPSTPAPARADALRWICACLNSAAGHAWAASHNAGRGVQAEDWKRFPLPAYNPEIALCVEELERLPRPANLADTPTWDPPDTAPTPARGTPKLPGMEDDEPVPDGRAYWEAVREINRRVLDSYGLSDADREQMVTFLRSMTDPWAAHGPDVADLPAHTELRVLNGTVRAVDVSTQTVTLKLSWAPFRREAVTMPIPKFMPGWALEEGREFTCRAPYPLTLEALRANAWLLRDFRPLPYRYLSVEDMERMLGYTPIPTGTSANRTD